jgi:hypothetical protein
MSNQIEELRQIYDRNGFRLTSYGNGWAYLLEWLDDAGKRDKSVWFQDDAATAFRVEFDAAWEAIGRLIGPDNEVETLSDRIMANLFNEYSEVAQTDENAR